MAKRNVPVVVCEELEPDPNAHARYLEQMPHGGYLGSPAAENTREGLENREPAEPYTHHHNPQQQHARTVSAEHYDGRATGADRTDDGLSCVEPLRADLDDGMK